MSYDKKLQPCEQCGGEKDVQPVQSPWGGHDYFCRSCRIWRCVCQECLAARKAIQRKDVRSSLVILIEILAAIGIMLWMVI